MRHVLLVSGVAERIAVFLNYGQIKTGTNKTTTVQKQKQVKNINGKNLNAIVITRVCIGKQTRHA